MRASDINPLVSAAQVASYRANGFLAMQHLADAEEVLKLREIGNHLMVSRVGYPERFDFYSKEDTAKSPQVAQVFHACHFDKRLERTETRRRSLAIAKQVLGPRARFIHDSYFYKPSGSVGVTPWHQDEAFADPAIEIRQVTVWIPLQEVDLENGCLQFIPGSHRGPVLPHQSIDGKPDTHALVCRSGFDSQKAVVCELPAGGCTLHDVRTLHFAGPNQSSGPRYAYQMVFGLPRRRSREVRTFPWRHREAPPSMGMPAPQQVVSSAPQLKRDALPKRLLRHWKNFDPTNPFEWGLVATRLKQRLARKLGH